MSTINSKLKNVSIRTKIAGAFAVMVLIIGGLGVFSVDRLARVNATTVDVNTNWLPSIRYLSDLRYAAATRRVLLARHIIATDEAGKKDIESRITDSVDKNLADARKGYEPLINSPEERAAYKKFNDTFDAYRKAADEAIALSHRDNRAAAEFFSTKVTDMGRDAELSIDKLVEINLKGAGEAGKLGDELYGSSRLFIWSALGLALFFAFGAGYFLTGSVARPVVGMTEAMTRLASHDMDAAIPAIGQTDEIGRMANAVQVFKENMIKAAAAADHEAAEQKARAARTAAIESLTQGFDADMSLALKTVAAAATEMQATATSMTATAEETSRQSTAVAAAAEQASTNVQTVASAAEQLTSSITEISRQVAQSARIAGQAVGQAQKTNAQVESLAATAQKIGDVVKLISDIAGQTNLLALNATIEAARAGEAGKGFAVVASEVKSLATQTAKATEDISSQIATIQAATRDSVNAIKEIGSTITEINEIATTIASAVEEQGAATKEIARNVQQAAAGTTEVTSNITGVNRAAADTGAAATQVLGSASDLSQQAETLRGQVETFLTAVKAA